MSAAVGAARGVVFALTDRGDGDADGHAASSDREWQETVLGTRARPRSAVPRNGARSFPPGKTDLRAVGECVSSISSGRLYECSSQDLDALWGSWWPGSPSFARARRPRDQRTGRPNTHIALAPGYYQNYLLGRMMSFSGIARLRQNAGGIEGRSVQYFSASGSSSRAQRCIERPA
jgi:hypothetical protein